MTGAVVAPIHLSTTFAQESPGVHQGYDYSRAGNPTRDILETLISSLENGVGGAAFASGMAAISALIQLYDQGTHVIVGENVYGGTFRVFEKVFARMGFATSFVDTRNLAAMEQAFCEHTRLVLIETPTNPMMHITDIRAVATLAHDHGAKLAVDNTFLTPYFQRPLDLGADFVIHSATKYLGGHSDVIAGLIAVASQDDLEGLRYLQKAMGAILSPFDCWLLVRSIKTLGIRMEAHQLNALAIARHLEAHEKVKTVLYPGLESHSQHALSRNQSTGTGGLLSFEMKEGTNPTAFLQALRIMVLAESLGAVETLVCVPAAMTHLSVPEDRRRALGMNDRLIRISVGVEDIKDLISDLDRALDHA